MVAAPGSPERKWHNLKVAATGAVETLIGNCFPTHRDGFHWVGIWDTAATRMSSCDVAGQLQ